MKITRAVVPSLFTVLNIFCGFSSIVHSSSGDFILASWFILMAGIFDVFDGLMARITKSSSDFGVEFDSLSDVVSFGAAPAFMVYKLQLQEYEGMGILLSSMPLIFGALRLARFNSQLVGYDKEYFKGLPIPASAIIICSFVLTYYQPGGGLAGIAPSLLVPVIVVVSLLMVSTVRYDTLPKISGRSFKMYPLRFTLGIIGLTVIVATRGQAVFPVFVAYVATGPIRYVVDFIRHALHPSPKDGDEKDAEITSVDI
jgi:CDP-diacylglycerol--serine O-phosphatidyltransferase